MPLGILRRNYEGYKPYLVQFLRSPDQLAHDVDSRWRGGLRLIGHAPDDDARMILVPLNHPFQCRHGLVENALIEYFIPLSGEIVAPPIDRHLFAQHESHLVVEREDLRGLRVVYTHHGYAGVFHAAQIGKQQFPRGARPEPTAFVIAIHSLSQEPPAIY